MSGSRAGMKRRLAVLEEQARGQTKLGFIVVYEELATGGTVVTTRDGRTFCGAEADALIAAANKKGGYGPHGNGGMTAIHGICLDVVLGRVPFPGGPYDELIAKRLGRQEGLEQGEGGGS